MVIDGILKVIYLRGGGTVRNRIAVNAGRGGSGRVDQLVSDPDGFRKRAYEDAWRELREKKADKDQSPESGNSKRKFG
jgi:hypothetical protein